jgi:hypothetical protein
MDQLFDLAHVEKELVSEPQWCLPEAKNNCVWFEAPLQVNGIVETGLFLHGRAFADIPDADVSFEVRLRLSKHCIRLGRLDWRTFKEGHTNDTKKPKNEWSGKRLKHTHFHDFDLNWLSEKSKLRKGNLPIARDFVEEYQSFESARDLAGKLLKINNINLVKAPEWMYNLFDDA